MANRQLPFSKKCDRPVIQVLLKSAMRSPHRAEFFYHRGIIESWGRGTLKMIELTQRAGLTPPEFECRTGEVIVRVFPTLYVPPTRVDHQLSALQRELLEVLAQGSKSLREILVMLRETTPERTVQDNLKICANWGWWN